MVEGHENIKMSNSIIDYVFRALGLEYLDRTDIVQVPPKDKSHTEPVAVEEKPAEQVVPVQKVEAVAVEEKPAEQVVPVQKVEAVAVEQAENSVSTVQEVLGDMMGDAPACPDCGHITIRNGSCYKCLNCGNSLGCS